LRPIKLTKRLSNQLYWLIGKLIVEVGFANEPTRVPTQIICFSFLKNLPLRGG
jgi:hypothetical protein